MAGLAPGYEAVVPRVDGRWHPLHAVYAVEAYPALERVWASGLRRMTGALDALRIREVAAADLAAFGPHLLTPRTPSRHGKAGTLARAGGGGDGSMTCRGSVLSYIALVA